MREVTGNRNLRVFCSALYIEKTDLIFSGVNMELLSTAWDFFQNEILGMHWLYRLISTVLNACGLDTTTRIGGSVQFFIYDIIKIMVLLVVLIFIISYICFLK